MVTVELNNKGVNALCERLDASRGLFFFFWVCCVTATRNFKTNFKSPAYASSGWREVVGHLLVGDQD